MNVTLSEFYDIARMLDPVMVDFTVRLFLQNPTGFSYKGTIYVLKP